MLTCMYSILAYEMWHQLHSEYSILHVFWGLFLCNAVGASIFLVAAYSSTVQMNKLLLIL